MDWHAHPEHLIFTNHYRNGEGRVPKPISFEQMKDAASRLSKGFPVVRVDFYEVDGKLFFGELTFMSSAAQIVHYTKDFLIELGNQCILPTDKK